MSIQQSLRTSFHLLLVLSAAHCTPGDGGAPTTDETSSDSGGDASPTDEGPTGGSTAFEDPTAAMAAICAEIFACECSAPPFASLEACVAGWTDEAEALKKAAADLGLQYDPGCLDVTAEIYASIDCAGGYPKVPPGCEWDCKSVYGTKAIDEDCIKTEIGDDCAQGLKCSYEWVCVAACDGQEGDACEYKEDCGEGLYCRSDGENVCARYLDVDAACSPEIDQCADGHYCHAAKLTCEAFAGLDEACAVESYCDAGLACDLETLRCVPEPATGEPCGDQLECEDGAYCIIGFNGTDDICTAYTPVGEFCEDDTIWCADSSSCLDNVCTAFDPYVCQ